MGTAQHAGRLVDDRYEVLSVLGGGASAVVYLARQTSVDRDVALKVCRPEVFLNESDLQRYLREAKIVAALNHPNIVTLYDFGRLGDGRPYMVMELVPGQSLNRLLNDGGRLSVDEALSLFEQVAHALGHAHRAGVVHRDIKPGNILLEYGSAGFTRVRVADFGVASLESSAMTQAGAIIGTPMYMSPEQAQGLPVSAASDIYALGVVMYRCVTGEKPFNARTPLALAMCHVTDPIRPIREAAPELDIPDALVEIINRCLEKEPEDRYGSADDLLDDIEAVRIQQLQEVLELSEGSLDSAMDVPPVQVARGPSLRVVGLVVANLAALVVAFVLGAGLSYQAVEPVLVRVPQVVTTEVVELVDQVGPPWVPEAPPAEAPPPQTIVVQRLEPTPVQVVMAAPPAPASIRAGLEPRVGPGGIAHHWVGDMEGRTVELELTGGASVVGRLRLKAGPSWTSRELVGELREGGQGRLRLELHELEHDRRSLMEVELVEGHAWGTYQVGDRKRSLSLRPRS